MRRLKNSRKSEREEPLFKRSDIVLLDEKQWQFLQKRYHMTDRELEVAKFVCHGFSNEEMAKILKIKQGTIKTHLRNIYRRVRVKSKIALLLRFIEDASKFYSPDQVSAPAIPIREIRSSSRLSPKNSHKKQ